MDDRWASFFDNSRSVCRLFLDRRGVISSCNRAFVTLLAMTEAPVGSEFIQFRLEGETALYQGDEGEDIRSGHVCLQRPRGGSVELMATTIPADGGRWFIGELIRTDDVRVAERLSAMNLELLQTSRELHRRNLELQRAKGLIHNLSGLLPICAHCKKIRDDQGYWNQIESFIHERADVDFSHSMCPDCLKTHYADLFAEDEGATEREGMD